MGVEFRISMDFYEFSGSTTFFSDNLVISLRAMDGGDVALKSVGPWDNCAFKPAEFSGIAENGPTLFNCFLKLRTFPVFQVFPVS